jgi:hypothetical protein
MKLIVLALVLAITGCVARYELRGSADDILANELAARSIYGAPGVVAPGVNSPRSVTTINVR